MYLGERMLELFDLALQPAGFQLLVPERILSRLRPPFEPQHGLGRPADGEQDNAGDVDDAQKGGHGRAAMWGQGHNSLNQPVSGWFRYGCVD